MQLAKVLITNLITIGVVICFKDKILHFLEKILSIKNLKLLAIYTFCYLIIMLIRVPMHCLIDKKAMSLTLNSKYQRYNKLINIIFSIFLMALILKWVRIS